MKTLEENKIDRLNFLKKVYEKKTRGGLQIFEASKIAEEIDLEGNEADLIVEYLEGEGLLETHNDSGELISITHFGKLKIEEALSNPNEPTEYFPPVNIIYNYGEMHNSQIAQGSSYTTQTLSITKNQGLQLSEFVKLFEKKIAEIPFKSEDDKNEAIAEVATIKAQLSSPKPKWEIVKQAGGTVKGILEKAAGSVLADQLLELLKNSL